MKALYICLLAYLGSMIALIRFVFPKETVTMSAKPFVSEYLRDIISAEAEHLASIRGTDEDIPDNSVAREIERQRKEAFADWFRARQGGSEL